MREEAPAAAWSKKGYRGKRAATSVARRVYRCATHRVRRECWRCSGSLPTERRKCDAILARRGAMMLPLQARRTCRAWTHAHAPTSVHLPT